MPCGQCLPVRERRKRALNALHASFVISVGSLQIIVCRWPAEAARVGVNVLRQRLLDALKVRIPDRLRERWVVLHRPNFRAHGAKVENVISPASAANTLSSCLICPGMMNFADSLPVTEVRISATVCRVRGAPATLSFIGLIALSNIAPACVRNVPPEPAHCFTPARTFLAHEIGLRDAPIAPRDALRGLLRIV